MSSIDELSNNGIYRDPSGRYWFFRKPFTPYQCAFLLIFDLENEHDFGVDLNTFSYVGIVLDAAGIWTICFQPENPARAVSFASTLDPSCFEFTGRYRGTAAHVAEDDTNLEIDKTFRDIMRGVEL